MPKFEVLAGKHSHDDGRVYRKGDVVTSGTDLDALFRNKFRRLHEAENGGGSTRAAAPPEADKAPKRKKVKLAKKKEAPAPAAASDERGENATATFDLPEGAEGLSIHRRGTWYHVYDGDAPAPINDKGLKKSAVVEFIQSWLEE